MYSTYEAPFAGAVKCEAEPTEREKIVILGGGPNRIGQGIEFDYCCCHASFALSEAGYETIMINCNPETVSTDYDTSDRLYFEPLTAEDVLAILDKERERGTLKGVIVQFGGQTPLKLAHAIEQSGAPILGTSVDSIDLAEDRDRFKRLLDKLGLKQPKNGIAYSVEQARLIAADLGLPLVVRPSYVLGGRAMAIIHDSGALDDYLLGVLPSLVPSDVKARYPNDKTGQINTVLGKNPLLFDRYLADAIEIDVDAISDGKTVVVAGIMEHIEEAGIHSGDSACSLPPRSLKPETIASLEEQTKRLALALEVGGLMNVQYALKGGEIYVLEVNPRASRTVPFVAKVIGKPIAAIAARVMAGEPLASFDLTLEKLDHVGVKEAVFPFARFPGVDTVLGPEMRSTGEVMGIDRSFEVAFAKSQLGAGSRPPTSGAVFVSVRDADKEKIVEPLRTLQALGFKILATAGTQRFLTAHGLKAEKVNKVSEGRPHAADAVRNGGGATHVQHHRGRDLARRFQASCAAPPSCKRRPTTPQFQAPSRRPKAYAPSRRANSKSGRCRTIWRDGAKWRRRGGVFLYGWTMDKLPITAAGHAALEAEFLRRQQVERPRIIAAIAEARSHGDLSENAEYHSAKEAQSHNEGRIVELEDLLQRAEVIDVAKLNGTHRSSSARP